MRAALACPSRSPTALGCSSTRWSSTPRPRRRSRLRCKGLSAPRPADGEPDRRPSGQRRLDALLEVVRRGVASATGSPPPRRQSSPSPCPLRTSWPARTPPRCSGRVRPDPGRPQTARRGPRGRAVGRGRAAPRHAASRPRQPAGPCAGGDGHPAGVRRAARRLGDGAPRAERTAAAGVRRAQARLAVGRRARRDRGGDQRRRGQATERTGPFGAELQARVPAQPDRRRQARSWSGSSAWTVPAGSCAECSAGRRRRSRRGGAARGGVAEVVVVRGEHPVPPRDLLEIRLPPEAAAALEEQAKAQQEQRSRTGSRPSPAPSSAARRSPRPASAGRSAAEKETLQFLLDVLGGDEEQLVARPPAGRPAAARAPGPRAGSPPARCRPASRWTPTCWPASGASSGMVSSTRLASLCPKRHQPDQVADADRLLDEGRQQPRRGHGHVDAPRLVEQPFVARVVDPGDHPRHAVLGLGEQRRPPG